MTFLGFGVRIVQGTRGYQSMAMTRNNVLIGLTIVTVAGRKSWWRSSATAADRQLDTGESSSGMAMADTGPAVGSLAMVISARETFLNAGLSVQCGGRHDIARTSSSLPRACAQGCPYAAFRLRDPA